MAAKKNAAKRSAKTSVKPLTRPTGKGGTPLPITTKPFTKENQPSRESKRLGWAKKNALKDILNLSTGKIFDGEKKNYRKLAATYLGIPEKDVTIRMVMEFRQIEKAIKDGETSAFNAIFDRAYGRVKQEGEAPQSLVITIKGSK